VEVKDFDPSLPVPGKAVTFSHQGKPLPHL